MSSKDGVLYANSWKFQSQTSHFQDCQFSTSVLRRIFADTKIEMILKPFVGNSSSWACMLRAFGLGTLDWERDLCISCLIRRRLHVSLVLLGDGLLAYLDEEAMSGCYLTGCDM